MNRILALLGVVLFFGSGWWALHGTWPAEWWVRALAFLVIFLSLSISFAAVAKAEFDARWAANHEHALRKGDRYLEEGSLSDWVRPGGAELENGRIRSIAEGTRRGIPFAIGELSFDVRSTDGDGHTSTHTITRTVARLSLPETSDIPLSLIPCVGFDRAVVSFLGMTGEVAPRSRASAADREDFEWLQYHYHLGWTDELSRTRAQALLTPGLVRWLRAHEGIAFDIDRDLILVWRPGSILSGAERDALVAEAQDLANQLEIRPSKDPAPVPSMEIIPPAVSSLEGVFFRLVLSGFVSWGIACVVALTLFVAAAQLGWMNAAPLPFMVTLAVVTMLTWLGSAIAIFLWLTRRAASSGDPLKGDSSQSP